MDTSSFFLIRNTLFQLGFANFLHFNFTLCSMNTVFSFIIRSFSCLIVIMGLGQLSMHAQVSLASENTISGIEIKTREGGKSLYTLRRDFYDDNQWYYEPNSLRLAYRQESSKLEPKVRIIKYSYLDKATNEIKNSGMMYATFTYAAFPEEVDELTDQIRKKTKNKNARVACMQYSSSSYRMLSIDESLIKYGQNVQDFSSQPGTLSGGETLISIPLSDIGSSVLPLYGIQVEYSLTSNGFSTPCGVTVKGSWKKFHELKDTRTKVSFMAKLLGIIGLQVGYSQKTMKENLTETLDIFIDETECENNAGNPDFNDAIYMQIVQNIQNNLFSKEISEDISKIRDLYKLLEDKRRSSAKQNVIDQILSKIKILELKLKAEIERKVLKIDEELDISYRYSKFQRIQKTNVISGSLELLSMYSEEDIEKLIVKVNQDQAFPEAVFGVPQFFNDADNIKAVYITIKSPITNRTRSATYTPDRGWWNNEIGQISAISFPLLGKYDNEQIEKMNFIVDITITTQFSGNVISMEGVKVKAFSGEKNFDILEQLIHTVNIDPTPLDFYKIKQIEGDLDYVSVSITVDNVPYTRNIVPITVDGIVREPQAFSLMIPKKRPDDSIPSAQVEIFYKRRGYRDIIPWPYNGDLTPRQRNIILTNFWKEI